MKQGGGVRVADQLTWREGESPPFLVKSWFVNNFHREKFFITVLNVIFGASLIWTSI